jgi:8-amino-7-oxononanoate synthase|tara:strand:+ start:244 stop:1365 length:1122 start_codon:yes stop_codon:yes gene_type:complete
LDRFLNHTLSKLKDTHSYRTLPDQVSGSDASLIVFNTNDYLGLTTDYSRIQAGLAAANHYGAGATGSRLLSGQYPTLCDLESALSIRLGKSALVVNSGYHANTGLLGCLPQRSDLILADRACHASLIDGARLSAATFKRYRHTDYDHLGYLIQKHRANYNRLFIVTESLFSMTGASCNFERLIQLKCDAKAQLIVDEAHAVGCYGPSGMGLADAHHILDAVDIIIGTFGKAWGSMGAFIGGSPELRDYLINRCRPFIYSTALPPFVAGVNLATVTQNHSQHQLALATLTRYCHTTLPTGCSPTAKHHIVPLPVGCPEKALAYTHALAQQGIIATAIRHPTVPKHTDLIRISLRANHRLSDIDQLATAWHSIQT